MIWPFKKKTEEKYKVPEFEGVVFLDNEGNSWKYNPVKHITANEVARLLPLFGTLSYLGFDRISYIKKENLERHFEITKDK